MKRQLSVLGLGLALAIGVWLASARLGGPGPSAVDRATPAPAASTGAEEQRAPLARPDPERAGPDARRERAALEAEPEAAAGPDPRAGTGALVLRAALADGTPAAGAKAFVSRRDAARLGHETSAHTTDADGVARVADLSPGSYTIFCPEGPQERAEVFAGTETEVLLELTGAVAVRGVVRDPEGAPVADAEVWVVSWRRDWLGAQPLTRTAADGSFSAPRVGRERSLGATADGFAPSALVDLEQVDVSSSPVALELVLAPGGGALRGRVLDPDGAPVAGARVAVGRSPDGYPMRNDGTTAESWCARATTTDASGSFAYVGLEAGTLPLHVVADGLPEHAGEVAVPAGGTATTEVRLAAPMSVRGVVEDESGAPVAQALVLALDAPFVDPFPTQGPTERGAPFHRPGTRSDDAGAFHLTCLPPGEVHLYASRGASFWDRGEFLGTAQVTLSGAGGATLEWNPVLSRGREIRGRVQYADGAPMTDVFVNATDDEGRRSTEYAADGRFVIPGLEQRPYEVSVQLWDPPEDARPLKLDDVWPSAGELVLTASYSEVTEQEGVARARIYDRAGRVEGRGSIQFAHARGAYFTDEQDGVFSVSLPPGRYQARVLSGDTIVGAGEWFDLGPGEERDLGAIPTRAAGSLVVRVRRPPGEPERAVFVELRPEDVGPASHRPLLAGEEQVRFEDLLAGPVTLTVQGLRVVRETRTVEVRAGGPTTVEFDLEPAAQVDVEVTSPRTEGFGVVTLQLLGADGRLYGELTHHELYGAEFPLRAAFYAPAGRHTFEATSSTGLGARTEIAVESPTADGDVQASLVLE